MSVNLFQNFDNFESWTLNGNAALASVHKFGSQSVLFHDNSDSLSVSNISGLFNLSSADNKDFECFIKPAVDASNTNWNDSGFYLFNGHAYKLFNLEKSWHDAKSFCENLGGHLATSNSLDKNNFLKSLTSNNKCWLGGTYDNDNWTWITGDDFSYSNWDEGEPNSSNTEHYIAIYPNGSWDDELSIFSLYFICEWDNLTNAWFALHGYSFFKGHSFRFFNDNLTWHNAKSACEALGGHLATSTSPEKNNFLNSLTNGNHTFLGATDELVKGTWVWVTGEEWNYSNWNTGDGQPNNAGGNQYYLAINDRGDNGLWDDTENENALPFICEWDADFRTLGFLPGYIFNFDNSLSLYLKPNATLSLASSSWNINTTSEDTLSADSWQHVLLRLQNNNVSVYLNGSLIISANVSGNDITPSSLTLGGFSGYLDEFVVHNDCDSIVSSFNRPYYTSRRNSSAPVSYAVWSCSNLPDGLTLSQSGLLEGTPTAAGTFNCNVSLTTNWGTANKSIRIVIQ